MRVLIMVAGVGSRISRHLHGQPKCCVDVAGKPLIRHTVEMLHRKGLHDIAIVTGYNRHYVEEALEGLSYTEFFNPFYRVTNSVASVWFAKDFVTYDEEMLIMNGDLFIEDEIIDILLSETNSPVMLSDSSRIEDADYRFAWEGNLLTKYGKELSNADTTGEYVGIGKLNSSDLAQFLESVTTQVQSDDYNCWWEDIIYRTINSGQKVYVKDIKGEFWAEVDYVEDYERIQAYMAQKTE